MKNPPEGGSVALTVKHVFIFTKIKPSTRVTHSLEICFRVLINLSTRKQHFIHRIDFTSHINTAIHLLKFRLGTSAGWFVVPCVVTILH